MRENRPHVPPPARAGRALDDADLRGALHGRPLERALSPQPGQGADRALRRVRPADADGLRRRPRARARRGRQGRGADRPQGRHARAARGDPAGPHEHVDDDQRDGGLAARALHRHRGGDRRRARGPPGHHAERHHQGVPLARDLRVPARAVPAADRRHRRLHGRARPALEPGQRLLLPPAGGRRDARAGDRLRDGHRHRGARRGPPARRAGADGRGLRPDLVLRQRRRQVRRGAREAARDGRAVGGDRPRALRGDRPQAPALPLRRAGQLARAHGVPAREQRAADRARGARRHARPRRPRAGHPASRLERGARPPAPLGPAVVAAHPAGPGLRDRPARVPRPLRGLRRDGGPRGRAGARGARGAGPGGRAGRRRRGGALHEGGAGRGAPRADRADRVGRAGARRRQPLHGDRALAARRGRRHPRRRSRGRGGAACGARRVARRHATTAPSARRSPSSRAWPRARTRT